MLTNPQEISENSKQSTPVPSEPVVGLSETQNHAPSVSTPRASSNDRQFAPNCHLTPKPQISGLRCQESPVCRTTPEAIRPLPVGNDVTSKRRRAAKKGKARILTDTPEKSEIEERKTKRNGEKSQDEPKKKQKNASKNKLFSDETSEDEDVEYNDESSDEDILSFQNKVLAEELENNVESDDIGGGDFVLVRLSTKKLSKFFVGKIYGKESDELFSVKYLKKANSIGKEYFTFIEDSEVYDLMLQDIIMKLPPPELIGSSSSRNIERYIFPVDLKGFDLG